MKTFRIDDQTLLVDESIYSTANGYIGVRGNFEEAYPHSIRGCYLNGFFDTHKIKYSESAYGFPEIGETMVNVLDGQSIIFLINNEKFSLENGKILEMDRSLDVENGYALRRITWQSPNDEILIFEFKRMTSFVTMELFMIHVTVTAVKFDGEVEIISSISMPEVQISNPNDPRAAVDHIQPIVLTDRYIDGQMVGMTASTVNANQGVQLMCNHSLDFDFTLEERAVVGRYKKTLKSSEVFSFDKYCIYTDEHKHNRFRETGVAILENVLKKSSECHFSEQKKYLDEFWSYSKIKITGDDDVEKAISFNMYQLLSSAGKDSVSQIAAKGLSGSGYEGHYFWDTEIYMLPFFTLTQPQTAKKLLKYRYLTLNKGKDRALELGHQRGVKIPWRTISGIECSSYFPAGTAQYHINADVAYAYIQYYLHTGDEEMMQSFGFEVLLETARLWLEVGHFKNNEFRIDGVTGPDEYTAIVNNNYYTNAMAKYHLSWVVKVYNDLTNKDFNFNEQLLVTDSEILKMKKASESMYLPYDQTLDIHLQDDTFLDLKQWDFVNTPKENYPLLLNYHPLTIYRHQVLKQADTILAHFLLDDVSESTLKHSFDYYESITTHDSSLSPCVYGMMASRINDPEKAYEYFMKTIYLDLQNSHGNTKDGLHIANAGGAYLGIVYGFAGLRIKADGLHIKPTKPHKWEAYSFRIRHQNRVVEFIIDDQLKITTDGPITIFIDDQLHQITNYLEVPYSGKH